MGEIEKRRPLLEPKLATPTSTSLRARRLPNPPTDSMGSLHLHQKSLESACRFLPLLGLKVEGSLVRRYEPSPPNPLPKATSESLCFLQSQMGVMKKRSRTNGLFAAHTDSTLGDALITFPSGGFTKPALDGRTSTTLIYIYIYMLVTGVEAVLRSSLSQGVAPGGRSGV